VFGFFTFPTNPTDNKEHATKATKAGKQIPSGLKRKILTHLKMAM
jgi:hypothetical protein